MNKGHYLKIIYKVILENPEFLTAFHSFIKDRMQPHITSCCMNDEGDERNRGAILAYRNLLEIKETVTKELGDMNIEVEDSEES